MTRNFKLSGYAFPALFIALAGLFFANMLSGSYLFVERDIALYFLPRGLFWSRELANGSLPLWNPYLNSGHPLLAALSPGILYPFSVFYLLFPFHLVFNYTIIVHFALAGTFTFWLMRAQKVSLGGAYVSAAGFMLGGYLLSVHNVLSTLLSAVWTPLFFLVFFAGLVKNDLRGAVCAGGVGVVMFLGGGVEICYMVFGATFILVLFPWIVLDEGRWPGIKNRALHYLVFCAVFFGTSAVQMLPFLELGRNSVRSAGLSYDMAVLWSLHPRELIAFFIPDLHSVHQAKEVYWNQQNWLKSIYLGCVPFLLSGFFLLQRSRKSLGYLLIILISLNLAFGGANPLYPWLFDYVPFLNKLRYPVKFVALTIFAVCLAAGFGYDILKERLREQNRSTDRLARSMLAAGAFFLLLFCALGFFEANFLARMKAWGWSGPSFNRPETVLFYCMRLFAVASLFCLLVFLAARKSAQKKYFLAGLLVLFTVDLFFAHPRPYDYEKTERFMKPSSNMEFILSRPGRFRVLVEPNTSASNEDVVTLKGASPVDMLKDKMQPALGMERKIFQAWGDPVTAEKRYKAVYELIRRSDFSVASRLLNMLNVQYLISVLPVVSPDFKLAKMNLPLAFNETTIKMRTVKIYENLKVLPRAFLVDECRIMPNLQSYVDYMAGPEFRPDREVLLEEEPEGFVCGENRDADSVSPEGERVEFTDYQNGSVELDVKTNARKFLFMSESYYPGWEATVDGRSADKILRANLAFRALLLEPGEHRIRMEFKPGSFRLGAIISAISLAICLVFMIRRPARRRGQ